MRSRRKHGVYATWRIGSAVAGTISSRYMLVTGTSAVGTSQTSSSASWYMVSANFGSWPVPTSISSLTTKGT